MLLQPKKIKYKKSFKSKLKSISNKIKSIRFGNFNLQSKTFARINASQLEATRQAIIRKIKPTGKLWILKFPLVPITQKGKGVRLGKGKGNVSHWVFCLSPGDSLFEINGISELKAKEIVKTIESKLPIKVVLNTNKLFKTRYIKHIL